MIALSVGSNTSSKDDPFCTVLLEQLTEQVLHLAETDPVYLNDPENGDFVMVSFDHYARRANLKSSAR